MWNRRAHGPWTGLLESVYRDCLAIELRAQNLRLECERIIALTYRGHVVADRLKVDLLVEGQVIVEVKSVERLHPVFQAQLITYLKLTGCPAALLMNFNALSLKAGLKRLVHPERYVRGRKARPESLT